MVDITDDVTIKNQSPRLETPVVVVKTPATADDGDTLDVTLSTYGADEVLGVVGFNLSDNAQEQPTWSVSDGVLTITLGGDADNEARAYAIYLN